MHSKYRLLEKMLNKFDSLLTRQRVVAYSRLGLLTIAAILVIGSYTGDIDTRLFRKGDFSAFYSAGIIFNKADSKESLDLYDIDKQEKIQEEAGIIESGEMPTAFINPPLMAWLMTPFGQMPYVAALNLWRVLSIGFAILSIIILTKLIKLDLNWWDSFTMLVASMPGFAVLLSGQNTFFFIMLYAIAYYLTVRRNDFTAGIVLGFGVLKPQLFLFLPVVLVFQKKWNTLAGFTAGAFVVGSSSIILIGLDGIADYLKVFDSNVYLHGIQVQADKMHSLPAFIRLIFGTGLNANYIAVVTLLLLSLVFGYLSFKKGIGYRPLALFSISILGSIIVAPHLFHYDLSILIIPFLFIYGLTRKDTLNYIRKRNYRLLLLVTYGSLWVSFFVTEAIRIQIPVLLIIGLFMIVLLDPAVRSQDEGKLSKYGLLVEP